MAGHMATIRFQPSKNPSLRLRGTPDVVTVSDPPFRPSEVCVLSPLTLVGSGLKRATDFTYGSNPTFC
ncbi:hypothetical protein N7527_000021 [Penicillium freii]|nr:hypothetical protein N7527_000021 [Penicillium freii]